MKKPEALVQLLEELRSENIQSQVEVVGESKAIIYLSDDAANDDDNSGITLNAEDCRLIFSSYSTIDRLMEALSEPSGATLALFDVTLPGRTLDILERRFNAVDEG